MKIAISHGPERSYTSPEGIITVLEPAVCTLSHTIQAFDAWLLQ